MLENKKLCWAMPQIMEIKVSLTEDGGNQGDNQGKHSLGHDSHQEGHPASS